MQVREGFKIISVSVPNSWMPAVDKCRGIFGNTRSAELREALRERLVKNGYGRKIGKK